MIKKRVYFIGLTLLSLVVSSGFIRLEEQKINGFHLDYNEKMKYHVANEFENEESVRITLTNIEKSFASFAKKMAYK